MWEKSFVIITVIRKSQVLLLLLIWVNYWKINSLLFVITRRYDAITNLPNIKNIVHLFPKHSIHEHSKQIKIFPKQCINNHLSTFKTPHLNFQVFTFYFYFFIKKKIKKVAFFNFCFLIKHFLDKYYFSMFMHFYLKRVKKKSIKNMLLI